MEEQFQGSVTAMNEQLVSIPFKAPEGRHQAQCFVNVSLVGPGMSDIAKEIPDRTNSTPGEDTAFYVTHYCVEFEEVSNENSTGGTSNFRRTLIPPESHSTTFYGALG
jgi:hypothetical protein